MAIVARRTSLLAASHATAAWTSRPIAADGAADPDEPPWPRRSSARDVAPAVCSRSANGRQSSRVRVSMGTRTTAGAGPRGRRIERRHQRRAIRGPQLHRLFGRGGAALARRSPQASSASTIRRLIRRPRPRPGTRAPRCRGPTKSAWLIRAWPIETSARCGKRAEERQVAQVEVVTGVRRPGRGCGPAAPRPRTRRSRRLAAAGPRSKARANGSV